MPKILDLFDPELQLINTKHIIKDNLKELVSDLKKFKVQSILVLQYKKRNNCKIFHSSVKLITSDPENVEAFKSMPQSTMWKMKKSASEDWVVVETIAKYSITIFKS